MAASSKSKDILRSSIDQQQAFMEGKSITEHLEASANNKQSAVLNTSTDLMDQSMQSYDQNLAARLLDPISI